MAVMCVTSFFAPRNAKRPINFIVIKYFLLGLLISNSIESILIIPKILDVLDQTRIQVKELEEINIKKEELSDLVSEKEREKLAIAREEQREVKDLVMKEKEAVEEIETALKKEDEEEEEFEEKEEREQAHGKNHHKRKNNNRNEEEEEEEEQEEEEAEKRRTQHHDKHKKKNKKEGNHVTVRKRPQRKETGANYVAVFMLFYGSVTLCLGLTAVFKESALLLAGLIGVSVVGILILISAGFSLIMIMSCSKDIIIALLTYKYRDMIVTSDSPLPTAANVAGTGDVMYDPNVQMPQQVSYS